MVLTRILSYATLVYLNLVILSCLFCLKKISGIFRDSKTWQSAMKKILGKTLMHNKIFNLHSNEHLFNSQQVLTKKLDVWKFEHLHLQIEDFSWKAVKGLCLLKSADFEQWRHSRNYWEGGWKCWALIGPQLLLSRQRPFMTTETLSFVNKVWQLLFGMFPKSWETIYNKEPQELSLIFKEQFCRKIRSSDNWWFEEWFEKQNSECIGLYFLEFYKLGEIMKNLDKECFHIDS